MLEPEGGFDLDKGLPCPGVDCMLVPELDLRELPMLCLDSPLPLWDCSPPQSPMAPLRTQEDLYPDPMRASRSDSCARTKPACSLVQEITLPPPQQQQQVEPPAASSGTASQAARAGNIGSWQLVQGGEPEAQLAAPSAPAQTQQETHAAVDGAPQAPPRQPPASSPTEEKQRAALLLRYFQLTRQLAERGQGQQAPSKKAAQPTAQQQQQQRQQQLQTLLHNQPTEPQLRVLLRASSATGPCQPLSPTLGQHIASMPSLSLGPLGVGSGISGTRKRSWAPQHVGQPAPCAAAGQQAGEGGRLSPMGSWSPRSPHVVPSYTVFGAATGQPMAPTASRWQDAQSELCDQVPQAKRARHNNSGFASEEGRVLLGQDGMKTLSMLQLENKALRQEVCRLQEKLRQWALQGYVSAEQAMEVLQRS